LRAWRDCQACRSEAALRQSMTLSHGSLAIFVTRPISAALIVLTVLILATPLFARAFRRVVAAK
jgi:putative tricarboxylic transport membrane protein